ncbi:cyclophilin type peptidyl-prolyl cis-trans isomerase/CLD family protein [Clostridium baratii str. Sullivan]|uniref:Peptidyl-prolyl cis-trans isomerase n=2 Tax=Clostridium baratii TaxID=1561 RepID=A0A0A7FU56_9CLOT|nr:cyclophilin type peptidyl-prolyl cis-trans isomerase/CLD family protein [Clostridium baratii str. Sullivan]
MKSMKGKLKFITILAISAVLSISIVGCSNSKSNEKVKEDNTKKQTEEKIDEKDLPEVTIKVKDYGTMKGVLYSNKAPNTVNNFIALVNSGFYDNLTFHRVIKDFMIQCGDPEGTGMGGPGYSIKGEFSSNGFDNDLKHTEGVLSMARARDKDSGGSQFFIMTKDAPHLNGDYAAFGKITEGLDVLHKIEDVKTDSNDKPLNEVKIESIKVDTKGKEYKEPEKIK